MPGPAQRVAEGEGQAGHVLAEDDLLGPGGVEEASHLDPGGGDGFDRALAGEERAAGVGVVAAQIGGHGFHDRRGHLRAAGAVEEDGGLSGDLLTERGEQRAQHRVRDGQGISLLLLHEKCAPRRY